MAFNLSKLQKTSSKYLVTRIDTKQIDKLIALSEDFTSGVVEETQKADNAGDEEFNYGPAISAIIEAPQTAFLLYCLAIIHCYSILENNRCEIIGNKIHEIKKLNQHLRNFGITHQDVRCYKTMEEFRMVNNAIKHNRLGSSKKIVTKDKKEYSLLQLKNLYKNSLADLNYYLADLYEKVEKTQSLQNNN